MSRVVAAPPNRSLVPESKVVFRKAASARPPETFLAHGTERVLLPCLCAVGQEEAGRTVAYLGTQDVGGGREGPTSNRLPFMSFEKIGTVDARGSPLIVVDLSIVPRDGGPGRGLM